MRCVRVRHYNKASVKAPKGYESTGKTAREEKERVGKERGEGGEKEGRREVNVPRVAPRPSYDDNG